MADTYIWRNATSDVAVQKATISFWVKKTSSGTSQYCFYTGLTTNWSDYSFYMKFHTDDTIKIVGASGGSTLDYKTNAVFRDPTAWMHIVIKLDMTETGTDRVKLYINGVLETSYSVQTAMTGTEFYTGKTGYRQHIGYAPSEGTYSSLLLSHYQYIDGTALAPTEFGETDATSGIWKLKTACYGTPGTNGFCLKMEDRTNLDLDSSSNALTMTTSGTGTATYDNPSNNFCTMNPLSNYYAQGTFSNGNTTFDGNDSQGSYGIGNMGLSAGLWYYEMKVTDSAGRPNDDIVGILGRSPEAGNRVMGYYSENIGYEGYGGKYYKNNSSTAYGDTWGENDIIGVYIDLTALKLYFAKNGTVQASGTGIAIDAMSATMDGCVRPAGGDFWNATSGTYQFNFGNGYFGTDLISSPQDDAGGIGAFKYDPSTGTFDSASKDFRAICTKNIKVYG